jgi:hypothetical protein
MKKFIHHIRKQPEEVRRSILHVVTIGLAVVLILLWVFSLGSNLANSNTQAKISQDLKPFSAIKDNIVSGYNDISQPSSDSSSDLKTQENSL